MVYTEGVRLEPVQSYWPHYFGQITDNIYFTYLYLVYLVASSMIQLQR